MSSAKRKETNASTTSVVLIKKKCENLAARNLNIGK